MANKNQPFGFRPKSPNPQVHPYPLSSSNSEILCGHPVVTGSNGYITNATAGGGAASIRGIAAEYKAASSGGNLLVWDDPYTIFLAQEDGAGATSTVAYAGENVDFCSDETSGNSVNSAAELDSSSHATTATLQFRLLRKYNIPNNAYGAYCIWECMINAHQNKSTSGT